MSTTVTPQQRLNDQRDSIVRQAIERRGTWDMSPLELAAVVAQFQEIDWPSDNDDLRILAQRMIRARWIIPGTGISWTNVHDTPLPDQGRVIWEQDLLAKSKGPLAAVRRAAKDRGYVGTEGGWIRTATGRPYVQGWFNFISCEKRWLLEEQNVLNAAAKHWGI